MMLHRVIKLYHSIRLLFCFEGYKRANYIRKHNLFGHMGENCYYHPWKMPSDPKHIFIYDNVKVASDVVFCNHDIANAMLNQMYRTTRFKYYLKDIVIHDNVLIGCNTVILPGKTIGPNWVVGGGAVVSKDVPAGTVVAGNPMREIGKFEDFKNKRIKNIE